MSSIFRPVYRQLDDFEAKKVEDIKAAADVLFEAMSRTRVQQHGVDRYHAIAQTRLEEAVMWAVKGVTTP